MRIGQLADAAETSTKTIRHYESVGILPEPPRTQSGYRDYDDDARDRLSFIQSAQEAGLTLAEIRGIIDVRNEGGSPCEHVDDLIDKKLASIEVRMTALERTRDELNRLK
jgi:DNA-binding transcriptional MerR regulator